MVQEIARIVVDINARGVPVVLVEQNAELALKLARYANVLETGRVRAGRRGRADSRRPARPQGVPRRLAVRPHEGRVRLWRPASSSGRSPLSATRSSRRRRGGDGGGRSGRCLARLALRARPAQPGSGASLARLLAHGVRRLLAADRAPARPRGGSRAHADHVRLPPAARGYQHHHVEYDISEPFFGFTFWHGTFYLVFSLIADLAGLGLIAGLRLHDVAPLEAPSAKLVYKREYRGETEERPRARAWLRDDALFLWALLLIGVTGFLQEGVRLAMDHRPGGVVAGRLGARRDLPGARHGRGRRRCRAPGQLVDSRRRARWRSSRRSPGPRRSTSSPCSARFRRATPWPSAAFPSRPRRRRGGRRARRGVRQHRAVLVEGPAQPRRLHQVRPPATRLPRHRERRGPSARAT